MTAIYKRELKSYFQSMTGYVLIAFLVIFTGIYFMAYNLNSGYPYFSYVLMNINYVLIIIIPMLTMRSFAEERGLIYRPDRRRKTRGRPERFAGNGRAGTCFRK